MVEIIRYTPGQSGLDDTKKRQRILKMHNKRCHYNGKEFGSLLSLANKLNVSKATITRAIKKGEFRGIKVGLL